MTTPLTTRVNRLRRTQRGAAAIMVVLMVLLGLVTLLTFRLDRRQPELDADKRTNLALAQAKEALLGRAGSDANRPGSLPCPDTNNDGISELFTGNDCPSYLGHLPRRTLDLPEQGSDQGDPSGGRLWYLMSPQFRDKFNNPTTLSVATISTIGDSPQDNIVAIVIAPGLALSGQIRSAATENQFANYLESFVDFNTMNRLAASSTYNDRMVVITRSEMYAQMTQRVTHSVVWPPVLPVDLAAFLALPKPGVWDDNNWNAAVATYIPSPGLTAATLTFHNCAITYSLTVAGVTRNSTRC